MNWGYYNPVPKWIRDAGKEPRKKAMRRGKFRARSRYRSSGAMVPYKKRYFRGKGDEKEYKFHDVSTDDAVVSTTWLSTGRSLLLIAQGTDESERIGRKIMVTSITTKVHVFLPCTTNSCLTHDTFIIKLMLDTQCNETDASNADIVDQVTNYQSFNNLANRTRFVTLWSKVVNLQNVSGAGNGTTNTFGEMSVDFTMHHRAMIPIEYDAVTGAVTSITSNNLFLFSCSRHGLCGYISRTRIRFTG